MNKITTGRDILTKNLGDSIGPTLMLTKGAASKGYVAGTVRTWKGKNYQKQGDGTWKEIPAKSSRTLLDNEKFNVRLQGNAEQLDKELSRGEKITFDFPSSGKLTLYYTGLQDGMLSFGTIKEGPGQITLAGDGFRQYFFRREKHHTDESKRLPENEVKNIRSVLNEKETFPGDLGQGMVEGLKGFIDHLETSEGDEWLFNKQLIDKNKPAFVDSVMKEVDPIIKKINFWDDDTKNNFRQRVKAGISNLQPSRTDSIVLQRISKDLFTQQEQANITAEDRVGDWLNRVAVEGESGLKKSLVYEENPFTDIEKSHVVEAFDYSDQFIEKKGREIKLALVKVIENEEAEKDRAQNEMNILLAKLPIAPIDDMGEYVFHGVKSRLGFIPKRFPYHYGYKDSPKAYGPMDISESFVEEKVPSVLTDEDRDNIRKYNSCAEQYIDSCVELVKLNTLQSNLRDENTYKLSVHQASLLGF